ncbi:hypothetical protein HSE3_gp087 [Bacillus phage vB_BceM-HSE3]|nr:hypothetical protein HSE3_gp087 [Bacillus phage vB_BceM-HSE3]
MSLRKNELKYEDDLKTIIDKMNGLYEELVNTVGPEYDSLRDYIESLSNGIKGSVHTSPDGVEIVHNIGKDDYEVIVTSHDDTNAWAIKTDNSTWLYASDESVVDYLIMSSDNSLKFIKDGYEVVQELVDARRDSPTLGDRIDKLLDRKYDGVLIQNYHTRSVQGQIIVQLPQNRTYRPGTNSIEVYIEGIRQSSGINYFEASENKIRFSEPLEEGWLLEFRWYEFTPHMNPEIHASEHYLGGGDEVKIHGSQIDDNSIPHTKLVKYSAPEIPTTGSWELSQIVYNSNPAPNTPLGWVCIKAGKFGSWDAEPVFKPFAIIGN